VDWYDKLAHYFPENELKHPEQMKALLDNEDTAYRKSETDAYVVTSAEFKEFIFIDYLLINPNYRSQGIGRRVLDTFKKQNKTIILEVEPPDVEDEDSLRRIKFYEKNGFTRAQHIVYTRSDEDGVANTMDVYFWSPSDISERQIMKQMALICREIHNFKSQRYYGRIVADPADVLKWDMH